MHRSKVPLSKWLVAFHLMCSSKKGVSALQRQRELGLGSYQTAWHMAHQIRYAMRAGGLTAPLQGDVEVDEMYVGGAPCKGTGTQAKPGRGYLGLVNQQVMRNPVLAFYDESVKSVKMRGCIRMTDKHVRSLFVSIHPHNSLARGWE
jgi:hypothetical protein